MKITFNVTGAQRKTLVDAISQELDAPTKYLGAPTFTYEVGDYRIDKNGTVTGPDNRDLVADLQGLHSLQAVSEEYDDWDAAAWHDTCDREDRDEDGNWDGNETPYYRLPRCTEEEFGLGVKRTDPVGEDGMQESDGPEYFTYQVELSDPDCPDRMEIIMATSDADAIRQAWDFCTDEVILLELFQLNDKYDVVRTVEITPAKLIIEVPLDGFTPEKVENLRKLVAAKAPLLKEALGTEDLPIQQTEETLAFPWFRFTDDAAAVSAYTHFVTALCTMAKTQNRVNATDKPVENEKYAFRCFLLRLGFIGAEYKTERKILLSKLGGSSSYANPASGGADDE